ARLDGARPRRATGPMPHATSTASTRSAPTHCDGNDPFDLARTRRDHAPTARQRSRRVADGPKLGLRTGMSKPLPALPALAAGCLGQGPAALDPNVDRPSTPIAFDQLEVGDAPIVVATGGVQTITIPSAFSVGWSGTASDGFDLEPDGDVWPNTRR